MNKIFETLKNLFVERKNIFLFSLTFFSFYFINVLIQNYRTIFDFSEKFGFFSSLTLFINLSCGFKSTMLALSFWSMIITGILISFLVSLIFYKASMHLSNKKEGFIGTLGAFMAFLIPGCAACGVGLISLVGLGAGFISFFPLKGLEISILAILSLSWANINIINNMYVCKLNISKPSN